MTEATGFKPLKEQKAECNERVKMSDKTTNTEETQRTGGKSERHRQHDSKAAEMLALGRLFPEEAIPVDTIRRWRSTVTS